MSRRDRSLDLLDGREGGNSSSDGVLDSLGDDGGGSGGGRSGGFVRKGVGCGRDGVGGLADGLSGELVDEGSRDGV